MKDPKKLIAVLASIAIVVGVVMAIKAYKKKKEEDKKKEEKEEFMYYYEGEGKYVF